MTSTKSNTHGYLQPLLSALSCLDCNEKPTVGEVFNSLKQDMLEKPGIFFFYHYTSFLQFGIPDTFYIPLQLKNICTLKRCKKYPLSQNHGCVGKPRGVWAAINEMKTEFDLCY